jgi:protocatechuate 3,4-dioxygenase alpha subunit
VATDAEGRFGISTVKPGPVPGPHHTTQAPHLEVSVFARGLLNRVVTRIYFADERELNVHDPVLQSVPEERRDTLLAEPAEDGYRFDVHLQGEDETVFFAV